MILEIIAAHATNIIQRFIFNIESKAKEDLEMNILKFCNSICGERMYQNFAAGIGKHLPDCLNFEYANVLYYENKRLFTINYKTNDDDEISELFNELPKELGLTGKCLKEKHMIVSKYGRNDFYYNNQTDNIHKLKSIVNNVTIPLIIDKYHENVISKDCNELIGILQLINYKGNLSELNNVILSIKLVQDKFDIKHYYKVFKQYNRNYKSI